MKYTVYILRSIRTDTTYVGVTSKSPKTRLNEHNSGSNQYTKNHLPYELIYYEQNYCKSCALNREKFLKSGQGRKFINMMTHSVLAKGEPASGRG